MVAHGRLKTKENFNPLALKLVAVAYERWSLSRGSNLVTCGILENWSLRRGGHSRRMDCILSITSRRNNIVSIFKKKTRIGVRSNLLS